MCGRCARHRLRQCARLLGHVGRRRSKRGPRADNELALLVLFPLRVAADWLNRTQSALAQMRKKTMPHAESTDLAHTHCHVNHAMRNLGAATACLWPNHASHRRSNGSKARPHLAFALVRRYEGQRRLERALLEQRRQGDFRAQRRSGLIPTKQAKAAALRINLYRKNRTTHTACLASSVAEERRGERHSPQTRKPQSGAKTRSA